MFIFFILFTFVLLQRLIELMVAKRNEKLMISKGAYEVGASHYPFMILLHVSFFLSLLIEVTYFKQAISMFFLFYFIVFIAVQIIRIWCLTSLGNFWNTKIIILPGANVVKKGPYTFIKHPNYVVVCLEILILPLMFNAYFTAVIFTLLNFAMLSIRIPIEEQALMEATDYSQQFNRRVSTL